MAYSLEHDRKFIITEPVVDLLMNYRQTDKWQKEAGGLLIGRHLLEEDHLVVDRITEPTWWDKRLRTFFFRSNRHNRILYKTWNDSNKTLTLLGLWHTHPEPIPTPSVVDYKDWENTLLQGEYFGDFLVFMIVGTQKIRIWRGDKHARFLEMNEILKNE
ncbi:MAG: Mov34/MPN/PAD-1 family protein [Desulfobulbaceae bacterium]|nr:Mov34/MPN/PAD-1 family protein [Desulfobulbaceae bacterium]